MILTVENEEKKEETPGVASEKKPLDKGTKKGIIIASCFGGGVLVLISLCLGFGIPALLHTSSGKVSYWLNTASGYYTEDGNYSESLKASIKKIDSDGNPYYSLTSLSVTKDTSKTLVLPNGYKGEDDTSALKIKEIASITEGNIFVDGGTESSLSSVYAEYYYTLIGDNVFSGLDSLSKVSFAVPSDASLTLKVGTMAFANDPKLEDVFLPKSLLELGSGAFYNDSSLKEIDFSKRKLTTIGASDGNGVFENCTSLESITLPVAVSYIGANCFKNCSSLSTINYEGEASAWNNITFGDDWSSSSSFTVHCSDADIIVN